MAKSTVTGPFNSLNGFMVDGVPVAAVAQQAAITDVGTLTVTGDDATAVADSAQTAVQTLATKVDQILAALRGGNIIAP